MLYQREMDVGRGESAAPAGSLTWRTSLLSSDDQTGGEVKTVGVACAMGLIYDVAALLTDCCQPSDLKQTSSSVQESYQVLPVRDSLLFCQSVLLPRGVCLMFLVSVLFFNTRRWSVRDRECGENGRLIWTCPVDMLKFRIEMLRCRSEVWGSHSTVGDSSVLGHDSVSNKKFPTFRELSVFSLPF